ncbi:MAG: hypothetical protein JW384_02069 [Nitrosomonadaceae bacterium]|nr:hypothetical protein [Nitrosomonadaceae bacterium]
MGRTQRNHEATVKAQVALAAIKGNKMRAELAEQFRVSWHKQSRLLFFFMFLFGMVALGGCANQPPPAAYDPPGFFSGLLHGFFIFFSFAGSIFMDIRIYAFPNSGFFYDLGYVIGAAIFLGGAKRASE